MILKLQKNPDQIFFIGQNTNINMRSQRRARISIGQNLRNCTYKNSNVKIGVNNRFLQNNVILIWNFFKSEKQTLFLL
jgi:hypothetical protein